MKNLITDCTSQSPDVKVKDNSIFQHKNFMKNKGNNVEIFIALSHNLSKDTGVLEHLRVGINAFSRAW